MALRAPHWSSLLPALLLFAVSALILAGCRKEAQDAPDVVVTVQASHPVVGPLAEQITADAILAPIAAAAIAPRFSAPIRAEYVQRGARVRKGQLLVSLDDRDLQGSAREGLGAVTSAQANLTATTHSTLPEALEKAQLDTTQLKAALDVATRTAQEREALYKQGALSGREADAAFAARVQAQAAYDAARQHAALLEQTTRITDTQAAQGQLTSARGRLENAEAQVNYAHLRSPISGLVTERPYFPGEMATAGTPVITVMDTSFLLAKLHLAQAASQKLRLGHPARITVPGVELPVSATVSFISPALDPGSTTVEVWLRLPNRDARFKVGTPVHAVIDGDLVRDAVQVPATAILPADDGGTSVEIVSTGGTAKKVPVTVGIRTPQVVQILSGISAADMVITKGGYGLENGTKVKIASPDAAEDKSE